MKKPPRSDQALLSDMIGFCEKVLSFTLNETFESFQKNEMCYMACLHAIVLLGEASTKVSKEIKLDNQKIPWRDMSDMRNMLVHWYHGVELRFPWDTIKNEIPDVLEGLKKIKI